MNHNTLKLNADKFIVFKSKRNVNTDYVELDQIIKSISYSYLQRTNCIIIDA